MDDRIFRKNNFDDNYSIQKNVLEIKKYLEKLQSELLKLGINQSGRRYTWRDWEKKLDIVKETKHCADLMIEIFDYENDGKPLRYGEWHGVHRWTFSIGEHICEIVCKLCVHFIVNFPSSNIELHATLGKIPYTFNKVLDSFKRITDKLLFRSAENFMAEKIGRRKTFLEICIGFNILVCQKTRMALEVMKNSEFRLEGGFKPLLASVVNQFHYIGKGCGLTRLLLERLPSSDRDMGIPSIPLEKEFKDMLKHIKCLLINGKYALRSLSYKEYYAVEINVACYEIKNLTDVLQSGTRDLNDLLEEIEAMSSKICKFIDLGDKCLPEGHQQIEDVTVMYSSDFDWTVEDNKSEGSESEENGNDFEEFIEDDKDDVSIDRISAEEIEDILVSSDVDKSEMLHVFKMDGFKSPVKISVNNHSKFIVPEVGGKIFYKGQWISAADAETKGKQVSMTIGPGEYFVVHYKFPEIEKEVSKEEMRRGLTIEMPGGQCSVIFSPSEVKEDARIRIKIHKTDENRIEECKKEYCKEYENVSVLDGVQLQSPAETNKEYVEFQNGIQPLQNTKYFCFRTSRFGTKDWECERVEPEFQNQKMMFKLCGDNKVSYIAAVETAKSTNKFDRILDLFLTLLGFKAQCKLLTLYKIPTKEQDVTIELCVLCIESKGSGLSDEASKYFKNKWIRIEEHDESSDFLITPGDEIHLKFGGNIGPKEAKPPVITFIKKGSCFSRVQLHCRDNNDPSGSVQMDLDQKTLDSKHLNWNYLLGRWKYGDQFRSDRQNGTHGSSHCNLL